jgi:4'-phosphopantetheinyl transferase EntD
MRTIDDASLRTLLPPCVHVSERHDDFDPETLYPQEEEYLARAVPKRRTEFVTTRRCVRDALAGFGMDRPPMVPGVAGLPSWPRGVVGSIAHCQGYRAAVVARAIDVCAVGVDAELAEGLPPGVLEVVAQEEEIERLRKLSTENPDVPWDRLLFSAKEAVYKAWFPLSRTWLGFDEADVTFEVSGRFTAGLARSLSLPGGVAVGELAGRWATDGRHLLSAVTVLNEATGASAACKERYPTS